MVRDLTSSNNELLRQIGSSVLNDTALNELYTQNRVEQQKKLKQIFTVIADNNVSGEEKKTLETGAEKLKTKIDALEGKMATLEEQISEKEDAINKKAKEITDLITQAQNKTNYMENHQRDIVKNCVDDVFYEYSRGIIGRDAVSGEIKKRVRNSNFKDSTQGEIQAIFAKLSNNKSEIETLTSDATKWMDQKSSLEKQLGVTQAAYNLINRNLTLIGNTSTSYTNSDYDTKTPVYSLEKTDIVSDLFADNSMNVKATNTDFVEGSKQITESDIVGKYSKYFAKNVTMTDWQGYTSSNSAFTNLNTAISQGLLQDLKSSNMTQEDVAKFFTTNFAGAQIKAGANGGIDLPVGQDAFTQNVINNVRSFFTNINDDYLGTKNTWDKDKGNTISSNAQIQALAGSFESAIDKLATQEPKFSFKEGMYALFDKDNGLFKDTGITFDLSEQNGQPTYSIAPAGDKETAELYSKVASKIEQAWGVKASSSLAQGRSVSVSSHNGPARPAPVRRSSDPITFRQGNTEFAFAIDRNGDNAFTNTEEFVGAKDGTTWLQDLQSLDKNQDGVLTGEELANLKILGSEYTDNAQTKSTNGKLHETTTNINYTLTNAQEMGIEEINLKGLEQQVNQSTGQKDINGSDIFNDSFKFKMNGQEVTASRKDDTQAFMNTVYGDAMGKGFEIGLSEEAAQQEIDLAYKTMDDFNTKHSEMFSNINLLNNSGQLTREAKATYNAAVDRMETDEKTMLIRASNKAQAQSNASGWIRLEAQVRDIANAENLNIDMEQAKGIYITDGSLDARSIVDKYKEQNEQYEQNEKEKANAKLAWDSLVECTKRDIAATTSEINELISSGEVKSVDDVIRIMEQRNKEDFE
ncbi:MAG: hypothetical protein IJ877_03990 [Candidatus Gastranaerophilales bacterium]|nr:hypothetical protein [Candidatus Gastranaerophilales bacterium]